MSKHRLQDRLDKDGFPKDGEWVRMWNGYCYTGSPVAAATSPRRSRGRTTGTPHRTGRPTHD